MSSVIGEDGIRNFGAEFCASRGRNDPFANSNDRAGGDGILQIGPDRRWRVPAVSFDVVHARPPKRCDDPFERSEREARDRVGRSPSR